MHEVVEGGEEVVAIVDYGDEVVGALPRGQMRREGAIHRVNYILVFNAVGEILVQRRTRSKDVYAGLLDLAAGGVVQAGESYEESAAREVREELGVSPTLTACFELWFEETKEGGNRSWGRVFEGVHEGPFRLQEEEVVGVEFMTVEEALGLEVGEVTPDTRQALMAYLL